MAVELKKLISGIIIVLAVFSGVIIKWQFDKDFITLYREGNIIAKEKWIVESERTYFNLDSWYDKNVKCPKIESLGGYKTATRCYYPPDYFEQLSRSLINTKIDFINLTDEFIVRKSSPNYKYGTRGAYAGFVIESFTFNNEVESEEEFPKEYIVNWDPKDTRNYKLVWRIENLKSLSDKWISGIITEDFPCSYGFGNVKIDFKDECNKLEKVELNSDTNKVYFYFKKQRGEQTFDIDFVDPIQDDDKLTLLEIKEGDITKFCKRKIVKEDVYGYTTKERDVYGTCIYYLNQTICSDEPINKSCYINTTERKIGCVIGKESYQSYEVIGIKDIQICDKVVGYKINNKIINFSKCGINCMRNNDIVSCDMCPDEDGVSDANCDGILQSGESGFKVDISKLNWYNLKIKADSVKFTKLRDCVVK